MNFQTLTISIIFILTSSCSNTFNREKWIELDEKGNRTKMAKSLLENEQLIGMTLDETTKLLGNPYGPINDHKIYYDLDGKFFSDGWILTIEFQNDTCVSCSIWYKDM